MDNKVEKLLDTFEDLKFDSLIFIFGIGDGKYLEELKKIICTSNKVYIVEPNKNNFNNFKKKFNEKNIFLIPFFLNYKDEFQKILREEVNCRNFINLYVDSYDYYDEKYLEEYDKFIELVDENYYRNAVFMSTFKSFKEIFIENIVSCISVINKATPLDFHFMSNEDIPAIIVSAGPSLDKNIKTMIKYKSRLSNFFIVAGNRTVKPLMENGINPDIIVAMDPQEIIYDMLKEYMNLKIPLVFYEQTNGKLIREYKGPKIYTTQGVLNNIKELENLNFCFSGGSVAHCSVDIAMLLGCNTIIFVGQDFAYTFNNHHAKVATLKVDSDINKENTIELEDVFGKRILSDKLLELYKKNMEYYIESYGKLETKKFINCSYGAKIEGAYHKELEDILIDKKFIHNKSIMEENNTLFIDENLVLNSIIEHIDYTLSKCDEGIKTCNDILKKKKSFHIAVKEFEEALKIIDNFVKSPKSLYFKGYLEEFLFEIKEKYFRMLAKDYNTLSTDIIYQCKVFLKYFKELKIMLNEVKDIYLKCIKNIIKR